MSHGFGFAGRVGSQDSGQLSGGFSGGSFSLLQAEGNGFKVCSIAAAAALEAVGTEEVILQLSFNEKWPTAAAVRRWVLGDYSGHVRRSHGLTAGADDLPAEKATGRKFTGQLTGNPGP
jgi:hypothetical protein